MQSRRIYFRLHDFALFYSLIFLLGSCMNEEWVLTLKDDFASSTAFSIKSSDILRDGCSLNTEFIRAILAALRRASAFVGQF